MPVISSIWQTHRPRGPAPILPEQAHPALGLLSFHPDLVEHPEALEALAAALRPGPTYAWEGERVLAALADDLQTILRIDSGRAVIVEDPGTPAARVVGVMEEGAWVGLGVALRLHWRDQGGPQQSAREMPALLKSARMSLLQPQEDPSLQAESQLQAMKLLEQVERVVRRSSRLRVEAAPGEPLRTSALPMSELQALLQSHPSLLRWVESAAILSDLPEQELLFSKHPQLCRLDPADRLLLQQMSALRRPGERDSTTPYQRAGEPGAWVGTVLEGAARLTIPDPDGMEHNAGMAVPGEIFGLEAAFPPGGGLHIPERPPIRRTSVTLSANCTFVETAWPVVRQVILKGLLRTRRDLIQGAAWALPAPLIVVVCDGQDLDTRALSLGLCAALAGDRGQVVLFEMLPARPLEVDHPRVQFEVVPASVLARLADGARLRPGVSAVVVLFDHDGLPVEEFPLLLRPDATVVWVQDQHHPVWRFGPGAPHRLIRVDRLSPRYVHQSKESAEELGRTFVNPELPTWEQTPVQGAMRAPDDPSGWAALAAGRLLETMRGGGVAARSCARLGRIVQGRAVGLALGGGGIWGAAHIALIRLMLDHHVPIDYVSGASFGSVVGGLYAGGGLPALEAFVQANAGPRSGLLAPLRGALGSPFFWAATLGAALSTRPIQRQIDGLILGAGGQQELPCTEVMFLPVATNLHRSCPMVAVQGTVGFGVRQSSGLPPMLPATLRGGVRLLDGAIISNVPAEVLRKAGASYVISANVVAPSTAPDHQSPLAGLLNASVWRLTDASRAMWVAMWKAGLDQGRLAADYLLDLWTADVPLWASWRAGEVAEAMMRDMLEARLGQDLRQHWSSGPPWPEQASARLGGARQEAEILRLPR